MRRTGTPTRSSRVAGGFTLVELIVVIVIGSVMAATLTVFLRPALDSYVAVRQRADLVAQADTALRRMAREVRSAVPNSIRIPNDQCFEVVPTGGGGRLRTEPDTVNDSAPGCSPAADCAAPLDTTQANTALDVLTPLDTLPAAGDWLVIGNQSPEQVYGGSNRVALTSVTTPAVAYGRHRLAFAATQFPPGYDGTRFSWVPATQGPVFFLCSGADGSTDAQGNGKGRLLRLAGYGFNAGYPTGCPAASGAQVLANRVLSCQFVHDPTQGATQQSGFIWLQLTLARGGERSTLAYGVHVSNLP